MIGSWGAGFVRCRGLWVALLAAMLAFSAGAPARARADAPPNLLSGLNPSFESQPGTAGWGWSANASATVGTTGQVYGSHALHLTGSVVGNDISVWSAFVPVTAGLQYAARLDEYSWAAMQGMAVQLEWWDNSTHIASSTGARVSATNGIHQTGTVSDVAPAGATRVRLRAYEAGTGSWDVFLDGGMIVQASSAPASYYDSGPQISFTGSPRPTSSTQTLPFTVTDDSGVMRFSVSAHDQSNWDGATSVVLDYCSTPCAQTLNRAPAIGNLTDGVHTLDVSATGADGDVTTTTITVRVDRQQPNIGNATPSMRFKDSATELLFLADDYTDGSGLTNFDIWAPGYPDWSGTRHLSAANTAGFACPDLSARCDQSISPVDHIGDLPDGIHEIDVQATDANGNQSDVRKYTVNVDTKAPAIDVAQIAGQRAFRGGDATYDGDPIDISIDDDAAHGGSGITNVDVTADDAPSWNKQLHMDPSNEPDAGWHCNPDTECAGTTTPHTEIGDLSNGPHTIRVVARDADNNETTTTVPIIVDRHAPTITLADNTVHTGDTMNFEIDDVDNHTTGSGLTNVDVTADQSSWTGGISLDSDANGPHYYAPFDCSTSCPLDYPAQPAVANLTTGCHTIHVRGTDKFNNSTSEDFQVAVNYDYPTSITYGGPDCSVDTPDEIDTVRTLLGDDGYLNPGNGVWTGLTPADQASIYPTSWNYGSGGMTMHSVDTAAELNAVLQAIDPSDETGGAALQAGMSPADQAYVNANMDPDDVCTHMFSDNESGYESFCRHEDDGDWAHTASVDPGLNHYEKLVCLAVGFFTCAAYHSDANKAVKLAERLFQGAARKSQDTMANAFQHAYWVALMVNTAAGNSDEAMGMAIAHENNAFNRPNDDEMRRASRLDVLNDGVGLDAGRAHAAAYNDEQFCNDIFNLTYHGLQIPVDEDPYDYAAESDDDKLLWRKLYSIDNPPVFVAPSGLDCSPA
jgi:hypothetical protein